MKNVGYHAAMLPRQIGSSSTKPKVSKIVLEFNAQEAQPIPSAVLRYGRIWRTANSVASCPGLASH